MENEVSIMNDFEDVREELTTDRAYAALSRIEAAYELSRATLEMYHVENSKLKAQSHTYIEKPQAQLLVMELKRLREALSHIHRQTKEALEFGAGGPTNPD